MIKKVIGDITKIEGDVIVNAANTELVHGGGVARAIADAAGEKLIKESKKVGYCQIGDFAITGAGELKAKKVFHVPTICYKTGQRANISDIKKVFKKVLKEAKRQDFKKVVTPLLGAGVVGLPETDVERVLEEVAKEFPELEVIIVKRH